MVTTPASVRRSEPAYTFDFCGGHAAIDFTNTVGSRGGDPEEHLRTFGDLVAWAEARGIIGRVDARELRRRAVRQPAAARAAFAEAIALREALYRAIGAAAAREQPAASDLALINSHLRGALSHLRLTPQPGGFALTSDPSRSIADPILAPVVRAAADLLTSDALHRVRACADPSCAWLFLDTTRSGTRRWCTMQSCGNRSKVRRFREQR